MLTLFTVSVLLIVIGKVARPRKQTIFSVTTKTALQCGCVLERDEVAGKSELKPCSAHRVMAESL